MSDRATRHPEREVMGLMLTTNADMVADVLSQAGHPDSDALMRAIAATRSLAMVVDDTLRTLVTQARAAGVTWAEVGDLLHVTRQAAFQRFGSPSAPGTAPGAAPDPSAEPVDGAHGRALAVLTDFLGERWESARVSFDERMLKACSVELLVSVRASIGGKLGAFQTLGAPVVSVLQGYTVVDVPIAFERGDQTGRVVFSPDQRVAGLFVLPPPGPRVS